MCPCGMLSSAFPNIQLEKKKENEVSILAFANVVIGHSCVFDDDFLLPVYLQVESGWERNKHRVRSELQPCRGEPADQ